MSEQKFRQTLSALEIRRAQLENIARQQELVGASLEDHVRARETLESFAGADDEERMLVPIGAGVFIHAKPGDRTVAIGGVGSGVMMERKVDTIMKYLDRQIEDLKKSVQDLGAQAEKISGAIEELSRDAQKQYEILQQGGAENR